eukprot:symbB.v1.2.010181.t1/scaffold664.1/size175145/1
MSGPGPSPISPGPVLLGAAGLHVGVGGTPKPEGQTGRHHGDIEASPNRLGPTVTRVARPESDGRPSWTLRIFQSFIALLVVIFTTWLAIALVCDKSWDTSSIVWGWDDNGTEVKFELPALKHDPSFIALMVSTGIAGLAAMWLYLIAPTAHTLLAAHFLCLNWVEGLVTVSLGAADKGMQMNYRPLDSRLTRWLAFVRLMLLPCEFLGLQFIIQNRWQSLWPALNRPRCKLWLARCLWMEVGCFFIGTPSSMWVSAEGMSRHTFPFIFDMFSWLSLLTHFAVPICSFIWIVVVLATLRRVVLMFHKAPKTTRQQGLAVAFTFQAHRGRCIQQCIGVIISLATTVMAVTAATILCSKPRDAMSLHISIAAQCINLLFNAAGIIMLSGASSLITSKGFLRFPPLRCSGSRCQSRRCYGFRSPWRWTNMTNLKIGEENDWEKKTRDLANRGISLGELLVFYKGLGDTVMPSFQPSVHTTHDVVRLAVIPLTCSDCISYAQLVNKGEKVLPKKMVTHNWSNLFRDMLASVISDALEEHTFEFIAELLSDRAGVQALEDMLGEHGSLQKTYWICAFAVNQHAGICGANPDGTFDPVTGLTHPACKCREPKYFNEDPPLNDDGKSIRCEMNKFDDMMALLARENPDFAEVVAVDASLDLFGRAWCVAELAEAHRMGMAQCLKMRNEETLLRRQHTLQGLKVENMKASRTKDMVEILAKIPDKEAFNAKLQELIFDSNVGLLAVWKNADALQQMEEVSHVLKWLRLSEAVEGGQLVWQRWLPRI